LIVFPLLKNQESYNLLKKHNNQQGHNDHHYATVAANATQVDCFCAPHPHGHSTANNTMA